MFNLFLLGKEATFDVQIVPAPLINKAVTSCVTQVKARLSLKKMSSLIHNRNLLNFLELNFYFKVMFMVIFDFKPTDLL